MATEIWCEIVCARCAHTAPGAQYTTGGLPRRDLKKEAAAAGYLFKGSEAFCSERCLAMSATPPAEGERA